METYTGTYTVNFDISTCLNHILVNLLVQNACESCPNIDIKWCDQVWTQQDWLTITSSQWTSVQWLYIAI